jgi:vitamin B12 transporter
VRGIGRPRARPSSCADRSSERHAPALTLLRRQGEYRYDYPYPHRAGALRGIAGDRTEHRLAGLARRRQERRHRRDRDTLRRRDPDRPDRFIRHHHQQPGPAGPPDLTEIRIRGSEANHTLVFIDGIKSDDPYSGEYDFGTLVNDEASRVEVLRGQQSSLYGSDAIGGVISYTTLSGRELPGISLRAEGGSMGTYNGGARVAGTSGDFDYALSSTYNHTDGYPIAPGGTRDAHSNVAGASGKFNWTPAPNFKVTAVGRYGWTKADTDDQEITALSPIVRGYPVIVTTDSPGTYYTNRNWDGLLGAQWDLFDGAWTNAVTGTIADNDRVGIDPGFGDYGDHGRRYRGSFDSTVRFGNDYVKNRFTMAVDAERQEFATTAPGGFSDNSTHRIDTLGFISQYDLTVDDRLAIDASARIDANSRFHDDSTYRVTASYLFPSGTRVHAAYGTGVKDPSASDLFAYATGQYIGNPNLKPERSKGWEAGIEQKFLDKRVTIGATYFDNRFEDEIDSTFVFVGGQFLQTSFNNSGSFKQRGVETYASARLGEFHVDLSYTYLHAPQTVMALADPAPSDGSFQLPVPITTQAVHRPKDIASANLTWAPKAWPITTTLTVRYNGKQTDYAFNSDFSRLIVDLRSYTLVNLNATWDITKNVQIFGRVENLLDKKYQEVFTYATPGRAAYGGVRLKI